MPSLMLADADTLENPPTYLCMLHLMPSVEKNAELIDQ
jgi:hypothetical protein